MHMHAITDGHYIRNIELRMHSFEGWHLLNDHGLIGLNNVFSLCFVVATEHDLFVGFVCIQACAEGTIERSSQGVVAIVI